MVTSAAQRIPNNCSGAGNGALGAISPTLEGNGAYATGHVTNYTARYLRAEAVCAPANQLNGATLYTGSLHNSSSNPIFQLALYCPTGQYAFGGGGYFADANGVVNTGYGVFTDAPRSTASAGRSERTPTLPQTRCT